MALQGFSKTLHYGIGLDLAPLDAPLDMRVVESMG
jgi:hypothetical protein